MPSLSVRDVCGLAYSTSRSCKAFHNGALPMMTVSTTRNSSNANWSCRRMPSFLGRVIDPLVGSKSPASIFIKVVLPAPLGPVIAYRRPPIKLQVTSSNRILPPNRIVMLLTESIAFNYTVKLLCMFGGVRNANYSTVRAFMVSWPPNGHSPDASFTADSGPYILIIPSERSRPAADPVRNGLGRLHDTPLRWAGVCQDSSGEACL